MSKEILPFAVMYQDGSDTEEELIALYLYIKQKRKRKYRRISVQKILQRRPDYSEFHHLVQELPFHPDKFHQYFRVNEEEFDYLLGMIEDDNCKLNTNWKEAITPRERLAIG